MKAQWARRGVLCLALIAIGVAAPRFVEQSRAQSETVQYQSSEEAAKAFMSLLSELSEADGDRYSQFEAAQPYPELWNMVSEARLKNLRPEDVWIILDNMVQHLKRPVWEAEGESTPDGKIAIVKVVPNSSGAREVICIKEGEGWRVDLFATHAEWLNISSADSAKIFARAWENARRATCQSRMKNLALGLKQYVQDNNERYPSAKNWQDAVKPYVKSEAVFHCPSVASGENGYAMNWKLSKESDAKVEKISDRMALLYETTVLKTNHNGEGRDMAFRHFNGANIAFVDGHVKWLKLDITKNEHSFYFNFNN